MKNVIFKPLRGKVALASFIIMVALSQTGCLGMLMRSVFTDSTSFLDKQKQAGPVKQEQSRIWIYSVGGGPNVWNTVGLRGYITIQKTPYLIGGDSYFYIDVPAGEHRVTTTETCSPGWWMTLKCKPGKFQRLIPFRGGEEQFIRIQFPANAPGTGIEFPFSFSEVNSDTAALEMKSIKYWTASDLSKADPRFDWQE